MLRRKIVYLISLILIISINIMFEEYEPLVVLLIMIIVPVVIYIYTYVISKLISINIRTEDQTVARGDKIWFEVIVNNISIFPVPNVTVIVEYKYNNCKESMYKEFIVNAKGSGKTRIDGYMLMNYCGNLKIGIKKAYTYDVLKIVQRSIQTDDYDQIIVMPKLVEPDYYTLHTPDNSILDSQHYSKKISGKDASEIFDIRDYRDGDNVNRIHWKLSAKQDKFVVKELSMPINKSNVILVELFEGATKEQRKNLDGVYEMAYAIGNFACIKEREFKLAFYSEEIKDLKVIEIASSDMLIQAMSLLIQENTYSQIPYSLHRFRTGELSDTQKIYYITSDINNEILEFLNQPKDNDFFIYNMEDGAHESESLEIEGAMLFNVDRNDIKQGLNTILI